MLCIQTHSAGIRDPLSAAQSDGEILGSKITMDPLKDGKGIYINGCRKIV